MPCEDGHRRGCDDFLGALLSDMEIVHRAGAVPASAMKGMGRAANIPYAVAWAANG